MARITVEDCIDKFPSRFELVLVASNRARKLHSGDESTVDKDNDKNTVIALREIAHETLSKEKLQNDLVEEYQTVSYSEEEEFSDELSIEGQPSENNDLSISENEDINNETHEEKLDETAASEESIENEQSVENENQHDVNDSLGTEDLNQENTENNN